MGHMVRDGGGVYAVTLPLCTSCQFGLIRELRVPTENQLEKAKLDCLWTWLFIFILQSRYLIPHFIFEFGTNSCRFDWFYASSSQNWRFYPETTWQAQTIFVVRCWLMGACRFSFFYSGMFMNVHRERAVCHLQTRMTKTVIRQGKKTIKTVKEKEMPSPGVE